MRIVYTAEAFNQLESQIEYVRDHRSPAAAERLRLKTEAFLRDHLANFPKASRQIKDRDFREAWIPGTRLVVWYRIGKDALEIISVWHTSQNRYGHESS